MCKYIFTRFRSSIWKPFFNSFIYSFNSFNDIVSLVPSVFGRLAASSASAAADAKTSKAFKVSGVLGLFILELFLVPKLFLVQINWCSSR